MKTQTNKSWTRYFNKDLIGVLVSAALAGASVYLVGPWIDTVLLMDTMQMIFAFAAAVTTGITYYVAKTHYSKGSMNVLKKIVAVTILSILTVAFAVLSSTTMGGLIPAISGIFIVSVIFYMVSLSAQTLTMLGMAALTMIFGTLIAAGVYYGTLNGEWAMIWLKVSMLVILTAGGVFAKIRMYLHGIRGVNNDGGFGRSDDDYGDAGDGDGDTGDE